MKFIFSVLASLNLLQAALGYRILLTSIPLSGHVNPLLVLTRELANQGHDCTVAVMDSMKRPSDLSPSIKWISSGPVIFSENHFDEILAKFIEQQAGERKFMMNLGLMSQVSEYFQFLHQTAVRKLVINEETKLIPGEWDLVVSNHFTLAGIDLSLHLKVPLVLLGTTLMMPLSDILHVPIPWLQPFPVISRWPDGSWTTSIMNTALNTFTRFFLAPQLTKMWLRSRTNLTAPFNDIAPLQAYLNGPPPLVLISSFQGFDWPMTVPPHVHYIGLLVPKEQLKMTLSPSQNNWLNEASTPVVYFSLGTLAQMNKKGIRLFVEAFTSPTFPYHVLWSMRGAMRQHLNEMPDLQERLKAHHGRIRIETFVPQLAVLNHLNVHVFLTHGGFNSISEAIWTGKPLLGIPFFSDQMYNVESLLRLGIGMQLPNPFGCRLTSALIEENLILILTNTTLKGNCEKLSKSVQLYPGAEGAVKMIEQTVLQGGTQHYDQKLDLFQIIAVYVGQVLLVAFLVRISFAILRYLFRFIIPSSKLKNE